MLKFFKPSLTAAMLAATFSFSSLAADLEKIHFIVPGGAGGGWDMTARATERCANESEIGRECFLPKPLWRRWR